MINLFTITDNLFPLVEAKYLLDSIVRSEGLKKCDLKKIKMALSSHDIINVDFTNFEHSQLKTSK